VLALAALAVVLVAELTAVRQSFALPAVGIDALKLPRSPTSPAGCAPARCGQVDQFTPTSPTATTRTTATSVCSRRCCRGTPTSSCASVWLPEPGAERVGVYALARELRAPRRRPRSSAAAFVAIPP